MNTLRDKRIRTLTRFGVGLKPAEFEHLTDQEVANLVFLLPRVEENQASLRELFEYLANLAVPFLEADDVLATAFGVSERGCKRARISLDWLQNDRGINTSGMAFGRLKDLTRREIALHVRGEPPGTDRDRYSIERSSTKTRRGGGRNKKKKPKTWINTATGSHQPNSPLKSSEQDSTSTTGASTT